jgi:hypothetical protein
MGAADGVGADDDALVIRGEIQHSSVPDLVCSVLRSREGGVLTFTQRDVTKKVHVRGGRIVHAQSSDPDERLGEILLVHGRITARQYFEASRLLGPGKRMGAVLVEMRVLDPEDLIPAVEQQMRDVLADVFSWKQGSYELVMREADTEDVAPVSVSSDGLVLAAIRQCRSWTLVHRGVGGMDAVLETTGRDELVYRLDLTGDEHEALSHVNGRSTVAQICEMSYVSNFETCRTLWALLLLGVIRRIQASEVGAEGAARDDRASELDLEAVVERFNRMFSRIHGFLEGRSAGEAEVFMDACMDEVSRQYAALFDGIDLRHYGRADYEQLLANVADLPATQRRNLLIAGLSELAFVMQLVARLRLGPEEQAVVNGILKDAMRLP